MRLLKKLFLNVHIHFLTFVYIVFSIIGGYFDLYFYSLLIVIIHEMCHLLMAYYFNFKIEKVEILPFGAYLSLKDFYFHSILEELCVVLAGLASHLFLYVFISHFCYVNKQYLLMINSYVFYFNLIPVYPMDGHRIVCLLLQFLLDLKSAMQLSLKISVFSLVVLGVCYLKMNTLVILCYLLVQQFVFAKYIPQYLRFYYSQLSTQFPMKKKKIHSVYHYRRGYHNYYWIDSVLYDEKEVIYHLLRGIKK